MPKPDMVSGIDVAELLSQLTPEMLQYARPVMEALAAQKDRGCMVAIWHADGTMTAAALVHPDCHAQHWQYLATVERIGALAAGLPYLMRLISEHGPESLFDLEAALRAKRQEQQ